MVSYFALSWIVNEKKFPISSRNTGKKLSSQLNETSKDFNLGNDTNAGTTDNETSELQASRLPKIYKGLRSLKIVEVMVKTQTERKIAHKVREEVTNALTAVENGVHDAVLAAMDNLEIPKNQMAVRSITNSSGRGPNSMVRNLDYRDFSGITENTAAISASNRILLNF